MTGFAGSAIEQDSVALAGAGGEAEPGIGGDVVARVRVRQRRVREPDGCPAELVLQAVEGTVAGSVKIRGWLTIAAVSAPRVAPR